MTTTQRSSLPFETVAGALREEILKLRESGEEPLEGLSGIRTLETNSGLVALRAGRLLETAVARDPQFDLGGANLLDLGCGFGGLAVRFAHLGANVTAIDPNESRMEVGRAVAERFDLPVRWARGFMQELPLPDRSFDVVIVNNALCYVVPPSQRLLSLVHIWRVLVPGGRLLMCEPSRNAIFDPFTGLPLLSKLPPRGATRAAKLLGRDRSTVRLLSARAQRAELARVGFERLGIDVSPAPAPRWARRLAARHHYVHAARPISPKL